MLKITSPEALDTHVAEIVRLKINLTVGTAEKDSRVAAIEKDFTPRITALQKKITDLESAAQAYCHANRAALFPDKKSRETSLAVFGFELTPPRVEPANRKIKWADVVARLLRLPWGKAYLNTPEPKPDKNALLADREKLTPEQMTAAGILFCQDEQFFIRPKPETAEETVTRS